jgi:isocitrate lyase
MTDKNRWDGIERPYNWGDVMSLQGSIKIKYSLADFGSTKFWNQLQGEEPVAALGALTGNQAIQQVRAGLKAIYVSGWQVAADANVAGSMYPDQSLYPANSVPEVVRKISKALQRADQIDHSEFNDEIDWFVPIIADAEAGFGGPLNAYELMRAMIEAGASSVHFEDQLASEKKCGHMGGKVLVPTGQFIKTLIAARLAADVCEVDTVIIARTDAGSAKLMTSDIDERDHKFMLGERTPEGFYKITGGLEMAINRGLSYCPYADMIWFETSTPDLKEAKAFSDAIHKKFPGKLLAYNCSPSFNWKAKLDEETIKTFREQLAGMGYKFQFVTLAGFHTLNYSMFELSKDYETEGMYAYSKFQQKEFAAAEHGFTAIKHQHEVGTGYFDKVSQIISGGKSSTLALKNSTEEDQF